MSIQYCYNVPPVASRYFERPFDFSIMYSGGRQLHESPVDRIHGQKGKKNMRNEIRTAQISLGDFNVL